MDPQTHRITGRTRMLFMLGDPIEQIKGNVLLGDYFVEHGVDAAVVPLHIRAGSLEIVVKALRKLENVAGFGVTMPHKVAVVNLLDGMTDRARGVGAVNFVQRRADGSLHGDNIDGIGFVTGLVESGFDPRGKTVLQIGAGGAGRAIAFALADAGAIRLRIANRSPDKAVALAAAVQQASPDCQCEAGMASAAGFDLVVNTTSLGMRTDDALPLDIVGLEPRSVVAEVVMRPEITPLLGAALACGCRVVVGRAMFVGQMEAAARVAGLWT